MEINGRNFNTNNQDNTEVYSNTINKLIYSRLITPFVSLPTQVKF